jgi:HPt (histidine-containing phosphotransfer) domain-containing protein
MRSLLSRLAFWWTAPAAVLSLFLPSPFGLWLAALAALGAGVSLSLRGRTPARLEPARPDPPQEIHFDDLHDVAASLADCARQSCDLGEALQRVAGILVHELGAHGLLTGRTDERGAPCRDGRPARARLAPRSAVAIEAMGLRRATGDRVKGYAVPVVHDGRNTAWLEFRSIELNVGDAALLRLLALLGRELAAVAARSEARLTAEEAGRDVPPASAPSASGQEGSDEAAADATDAAAPQEPHPLLARYVRRCAADAGAAASDAYAGRGFDPAAIERLRTLDPDRANRLLERVVRAFETSSARLLPQLSDAAGNGDHESVRELAHHLRSTSAAVGAIKLTSLCAEIEAMTPAERPEDLPARIAALTREVAVVRDVLRDGDGACP